MISTVIPTRDRPSDLKIAVLSVLNQTRLPDELIVIDQSAGDDGKVSVERLLANVPAIRLVYIHDSKILGLVDAKRVAVQHATGEYVCFIEDDVVLEHDYFEQVELCFLKNKEIIGSCGVITNPPQFSQFYASMFNVFHRGIFADKRVSVFSNPANESLGLIASDKLSGGVSSWRREVFSAVPFDVKNGFHMLEDIDFSTRVAKHFGDKHRLFINPRVRLQHNCSPVNREDLGKRHYRKVFECFLYYKKRRDWPQASLDFAWLLTGLLIETLFKAVIARSISVLLCFFQGLHHGYKKNIS